MTKDAVPLQKAGFSMERRHPVCPRTLVHSIKQFWTNLLGHPVAQVMQNSSIYIGLYLWNIYQKQTHFDISN